MKQAEVRIRDNQIANVVALLKDADSVEPKLTVPESDHQSSISALGIDVLDAELRQVVFKRFMAVEMWFYPDGSRVLELSAKCTSTKAFQVLEETRTFLTKRGIRLTGEQEAKTRKTLSYFSHLNRRAALGSRTR